MTEIFERLESSDREAVENAKQFIRDQFGKVNDPWLLNGLYEYYLNTNSIRSMEILVNVTEPHHQYLFDRLCESLRNQKTEIKVQALTLFGHVARSQPTWLYKLQDHVLLKEVLKLLKTEVELLPLISALLLLIVLLPMLPSTMGCYLKDIFDIFSRLASWNCSAGKYVEEQNVHMQVALYALFLRLYGMYPCNFLGYLRTQYKDKNNPVFIHTIKPMLDTVKMNPSLVTTSKDYETTTEKWKRMGVHDVIVECEQFSLDLTDRCPHNSCQYSSGFRSRSGTTNSSLETPFHLQDVKTLASLPKANVEAPYFTPSMMFHTQTPPVTETVASHIPVQVIVSDKGVRQSVIFPPPEGTSPPEAAVEAIPDNTPLRDYRVIPSRSQPSNSNIARTLTSSFSSKTRPSGSQTATPTHSQPSSPMRKEFSQFTFSPDNKSSSAFTKTKRESISNQKITKLATERSQIPETQGSSEQFTKSITIPTPSSPLRIIGSETVSRQFSAHQRNESPVSQEDEEVLSIVGKGDTSKQPAKRPCDSVLPEFDDYSVENAEGGQKHGSPCAEGGLHMPNSKSMNNFAKRVQRLRYHSQCNPEPETIETSTGSSPGNSIPFPNSTTVRRANSCPEMKKSPVIPAKDNLGKPLDETDEETAADVKVESMLSDSCSAAPPVQVRSLIKEVTSCTTQTENFWPMPYEHLFLGIFPSLENNEVKPSPDPSPAPFNSSQEKYFPPSVYDILDKYINAAVHCNEKTSPQYLKDQLQLLHQQLLFERHRRETHAYRNRRLLSDAKNTRLMEECNSALRDTVQLLQRDIDDLRKQLSTVKKEKIEEEKRLTRTIQHCDSQCKILQQECKMLKETNETLKEDLSDTKSKCTFLDGERQQAESALLDVTAEVNVIKEKARAGDRGRQELERVNKELVLLGELQLKYKEKMEKLTMMRESQEELVRIREAYKEEIKTVTQHLESKVAALEAYRTRVLELEQIVTSKEELIELQKQMLNNASELNHEKLQAVESKYQTQMAINRSLEEKILDLGQRLELEKAKRSVHSPDTSSCHEVNVTTTAGMSPHSSPLSASLASSEGSTAFHDREVKNLQAIVDQKESTSKSKQDDLGEGSNDDRQLTSSTKTD